MGVEKEIIAAGDGTTFPKQGDQLTMHYTGTLADGGKQFDSSVTRGKPFQFVIGIGQVIQGTKTKMTRLVLLLWNETKADGWASHK
jgi:FK506-binding protein 1